MYIPTMIPFCEGSQTPVAVDERKTDEGKLPGTPTRVNPYAALTVQKATYTSR